MATPVPSPRRSRLRTGAGAAGAVGLFALGVLVDIAAVVNVPGAATFTGTDAHITDLGTGVALAVCAGWASAFWPKRPVIALVAGALLALTGVTYLLLLIGAVRCVRRWPERTRVIAAATGGLVLLYAVREAATPWGAALSWYFTQRVDAQYEPAWIVASFVWAALSLGVAAGFVLHARTRQVAAHSQARAEQEHRRADALTEQMVRQAERERIARDMHDALAHRLSVVSLHAGALEAAAATGTDAGEIARTVREQTHAALQDMRGLIGDLRSGPVAGASAPSTMRAIGTLLSDLRAAGQQVSGFVVIEAAERATAQLDSAVHRIVQEAVTNAMKHARGALVDVFVQVNPYSGARIRVENALQPGLAPAVPGGGNGLIGIRERAEALGGTAWIGPYEGAFIVDVTLPWQERV
ncbi:sensor histidine kinase [Microbacterium sp.]|uniref:sensor histidine kinase n=1 Tax=Microbacterium sp. TaxID=51671 RepID=UPI0028121D8F|nr:histidine kinase [Microbacterium sp.]